MPLGSLPPRRENFSGDLKNSTISLSSSLASSTCGKDHVSREGTMTLFLLLLGRLQI